MALQSGEQDDHRFFMATLLPNARVPPQKLRGYRGFIFSHDHPRPAHIHFGKRKRFSSWDIQRSE
ncbi:MAG: hypothetical protein ABSB33_10255 [Tepidisphaeraceae bacterium]|jgi:hypothetical protein